MLTYTLPSKGTSAKTKCQEENSAKAPHIAFWSLKRVLAEFLTKALSKAESWGRCYLLYAECRLSANLATQQTMVAESRKDELGKDGVHGVLGWTRGNLLGAGFCGVLCEASQQTKDLDEFGRTRGGCSCVGRC